MSALCGNTVHSMCLAPGKCHWHSLLVDAPRGYLCSFCVQANHSLRRAYAHRGISDYPGRLHIPGRYLQSIHDSSYFCSARKRASCLQRDGYKQSNPSVVSTDNVVQQQRLALVSHCTCVPMLYV